VHPAKEAIVKEFINQAVQRIARVAVASARTALRAGAASVGVAVLAVIANEVVPAAQVEFNLDPVVTSQFTFFVLAARDALKVWGS
jgi:hypothetical protein